MMALIIVWWGPKQIAKVKNKGWNPIPSFWRKGGERKREKQSTWFHFYPPSIYVKRKEWAAWTFKRKQYMKDKSETMWPAPLTLSLSLSLSPPSLQLDHSWNHAPYTVVSSCYHLMIKLIMPVIHSSHLITLSLSSSTYSMSWSGLFCNYLSYHKRHLGVQISSSVYHVPPWVFSNVFLKPFSWLVLWCLYVWVWLRLWVISWTVGWFNW